MMCHDREQLPGNVSLPGITNDDDIPEAANTLGSGTENDN